MQKQKFYKFSEQINPRNGHNYILGGSHANHHHLWNEHRRIGVHRQRYNAGNAAKHNWHSYNSPPLKKQDAGGGPAAFEFETKIKISLDTQGYSLTLFLFSQIVVLAMFLFGGVF